MFHEGIVKLLFSLIFSIHKVKTNHTAIIEFAVCLICSDNLHDEVGETIISPIYFCLYLLMKK